MTPIMLEITGDFESTRRAVIAAMCYPRNAEFRAAYCLRKQWDSRLGQELQFIVSNAEVKAFLDMPSRQELWQGAMNGTKQGTVAGDLLALIYEQSRTGKPEPSLRAALKRYSTWSVGKKYGGGTALKYSQMQLRSYFTAASPVAHLWAAHRILQAHNDGGNSYRASFTKEGMPYFLGVAKALQDFATHFVPKRTKLAKPVLEKDDVLVLPESIAPIKTEFQLL